MGGGGGLGKLQDAADRQATTVFTCFCQIEQINVEAAATSMKNCSKGCDALLGIYDDEVDLTLIFELFLNLLELLISLHRVSPTLHLRPIFYLITTLLPSTPINYMAPIKILH